MPPAALLVCRVDSTRWPVNADWIAMRAVSRSRISPIMMMSGSWRTMLRSALAKSSPICGLAWIWLMPSIWYSTGSSTVMIFTSAVLSWLSAVYSVVVLPEPVGPVTSRMPCGCSSTLRNCGRNASVKPSRWKSNTTVSRSSRRITTLSPCAVGTVLTRRSSSLPCTRSMMRPSCGRRRSAMFSRAMILMRLITAAVRLAGGLSPSISTPSTR